MRRREFITLLGGAAATVPLTAHGQQGEWLRRIGLLTVAVGDDPIFRAQVAALRNALGGLGWIEDRNVRIDVRFGTGDLSRIHASAAELVSLKPDVIVTTASVATKAVQEQTQTIPIVITGGSDIIGFGLVGNLARPEGNITGFTNLYPSIGGKWLEILKEATPRLARVAVVFNPDTNAGGYFASVEAAAAVLGVQVMKLPVSNALEIVRAIDAFAVEPNGGLLVVPPNPTFANRELIFKLATQHQLPAIWSNRTDALAGGLMSYGSDSIDRYRRAASYVDRILRGEKASDLPIQYPTKFELVVNLKAAKAIGPRGVPAARGRSDRVSLADFRKWPFATGADILTLRQLSGWSGLSYPIPRGRV